MKSRLGGTKEASVIGMWRVRRGSCRMWLREWSQLKRHERCSLKTSLGFSNIVELEWAPVFGALVGQKPRQSRWRIVQDMRPQMWWKWAPFWEIWLCKGGGKEGNRWGWNWLIFFFVFSEKTQCREVEVEHIGERRDGILTSWDTSWGMGYGAHVDDLALGEGTYSCIVNPGQIMGRGWGSEVFLVDPWMGSLDAKVINLPEWSTWLTKPTENYEIMTEPLWVCSAETNVEKYPCDTLSSWNPC